MQETTTGTPDPLLTCLPHATEDWCQYFCLHERSAAGLVLQGMPFAVVVRTPTESSTSAPFCRAGSAAEVLRVLTQLPNLQSVDFMNQFLTGTLPPDVAFPSLQVLQLAENYISVRARHMLP